MDIPGHELQELLYESHKSMIYRGVRLSDKKPFVYKFPFTDYPTRGERQRYWQEFEITHEFNGDGVVKAVEVLKCNNRLVMIFENFVGMSLSTYLGRHRLSLDESLKIAISLAQILETIHEQGLVHKDLNPNNVLIDEQGLDVRIIDFGIASRLPKERPVMVEPSALEGTPAYISPEQTGRINRYVDARSDLYSLGITLYELFSGSRPFEGEDALELIHNHIARAPASLASRDSRIPLMISDIVMKLVEKDPDERYQAVQDLLQDLKLCLEKIETGQDLGKAAVVSQGHNVFRIPQKIYGRELSLELLDDALSRVAKGCRELFFISGYSGTGKTALVQELHRSIAGSRGIYISGKFDQLHKVPYSALIAAFSQLVRRVLSMDKNHLTRRRQQLLEGVGPNGQVLIDLIPEVEHLIGPQPPLQELGPIESQNRFNLVFLNFVDIFCEAERPLVIFLDDLQWADSASLALLEKLFSGGDESPLLIIAAYRDNEVDDNHPLSLTLKSFEEKDVPFVKHQLPPLGSASVTNLVADTLNNSAYEVKPLVEVIMERTAGNPFFVKEILSHLYNEGFFRLKHHENGDGFWAYPPAKEIAAATSTSVNVVDFVVSKLKKLPRRAQEILRLASCIGSSFDLDTLAVIMQQTPYQLYMALSPAIQDNYIEPVSSLEIWVEDDTHAEMLVYHWKFIHDRVQQAAYALIDEEERQVVHGQIANLLLKSPQGEERIFDLVAHFNKAERPQSPEMQLKVATLNLKAGIKALEAMAYGTAYEYLEAGILLLPNNHWTDHYDLSLSLHLNQANAAFQSGLSDKVKALAEIVFENARDIFDQADMYSLLIVDLTVRADYQGAIELGSKVLALLGVEIPKEDVNEAIGAESAWVDELLKTKNIADLEKLGPIADKRQQKSIEIMVNLIPTLWFSGSELLFFFIMKCVTLSFKYGYSAASAFAIAAQGLPLCAMTNQFERAYDFCQLALKISRDFKSREQEGIVCELAAGHVVHWSRHLQESITLARAGYRACMESGNFPFAGYVACWQIRNSFAIGQHLKSLIEDTQTFLEFAKVNNKAAENQLLAVLNPVYYLSGESDAETPWDSPSKSLEDFLNTCEREGDLQANGLYAIMRSQVLYIMGEYTESLKYAQQSSNALATMPGAINIAEQNLFYSLSLIKSFEVERDPDILSQIVENQEHMLTWYKSCPANFEHKYFIVEAELARVRGEAFEKTLKIYDQAIASAGEYHFSQYEALFNELAAHFWLEKGIPKCAMQYLKDAHYYYGLWGAERKVVHLEAQFPELIRASGRSARTFTNTYSTRTATGDNLSSMTILKAARAISQELKLEDLLRKLVEIISEAAGAQKTVLLQHNNGELVLQGSISLNEEQTTDIRGVLLKDYDGLPVSLVQYVSQVHESVRLRNAVRSSVFSDDAYIRKHCPKSILCMPILHTGNLVGILYLENKDIENAFSDAHLESLEMLISQASISIAHATLYQNLESEVEQRTAQLQTAQHLLIQSEKMSSLGTLAAGVAHEINNPANFVNLTIQNIQDRLKGFQNLLFDLVDDEQTEIRKEFNDWLDPLFSNLGKANTGIQRIAGIIGKLQVLTRIDEGMHKLVDLKPDLVNTIELVEVKYDEWIDFQYEFLTEPKITCWPGQLNQVFMNILVNGCYAIRARQEEDPNFRGRIRISTHRQGEMLVISIEDNGGGIPKEVRERIFEPFYTTKPEGEGTGLGLYICYTIIERHQGTLEFSTREGSGTTFSIKLPF